MLRNKYKIILRVLLLIMLFGVFNSFVEAKSSQVGATVRLVQIDFVTHPEKREPPIGNWDTFVNFQLRDCATHNTDWEYDNVETNTTGSGTIVVPIEDNIEKGDYIISIKGYSHLTKEFECRYFADNVYEVLDLVAEGELLAGDTSNVIDDFINSLDLSKLVTNLYTNDYKNDLNQDTFVNSLDLSNQVYNLYLSGDN